MLKRLAARGKQPPAPVSPVTTDNFELPQSSNDGGGASPVSPDSIFMVTVYTLDDDQQPLEINVQRDSDGQWLFDEACEQLGGVQEKDYYGLRYLDRDKQRQWVDLSRNIYRQLKHMHPCSVSFRVKHYPPNPIEDFKQEISKYFLFLQLKRDILHSRLLCQGSEAYELAAYIAQVELGDYEDVEDPETYLSDFKILPNQSPKSETKIAEIHKTLKGLVPTEAESKFLELASKMETYGIDPYSVKDQKGNVLYLGLTHVGVVTFQGSRRAHIFKWSDITKFNYDGKLFIIHVTFREDNQFKRKKKHILGFKCESRPAALSLWRWAVDRYCFFTLKRSSEAKRSKSGGGLFRRSNTFRFSGRCQKEALSNSLSLLTLPQPDFKRNRTISCSNVRRASLDRASSFRRDERHDIQANGTDKFATFPRTRRRDEEDGPLVVGSPSDVNLMENHAGAAADGDIVETIIVPTASANQHVIPPGTSERGIDVGDGRDLGHVDLVYREDGAIPPAGEPAAAIIPNDVRDEADGPVKAQPGPGVSNHFVEPQKAAPVPQAKSSRALWCVCLSSLLLGVFVSVGALVLLFEIGPDSPTARSLTSSGPGAVLEDWRQQWYLPLRNKFLPSKH